VDSGLYISTYWINRRAELQVITTLSFSHTPGLLATRYIFTGRLLLPLWTSRGYLLPRTNLELYWTGWELLLNWKLALKLASPGTRYITSAPTTNIGLYCWNVCIESLHSNCRGADNSEPIIPSLPSNDKQTLVLLLLRAFRGFYGFNSYRKRKTRHTAPSLRLFRPEQPNGASLFPLFFFEGSAFDVYVDLLLR
jgi:hypothetical protein